MEKVSDGLAERMPLAFKAAYPRNISTPQGYTSPRYFASSLVSYLLNIGNPLMRQISHANGAMTAMALMSCKVPTYFIADDFAFAAANTNLPGDFKFSELLWPLPSQLYVLSDKFCEEYYDGVCAPFLAVSRASAGIYPKALKLPASEIGLPTDMELAEDKIVMDYPVYYKNSTPTDYNGNYPLRYGIEVFKDAPWIDSTVYEALLRGWNVENPEELNEAREKVFIQKALSLSVKLLMAVASRPTLVESGQTRPATYHQGRMVQPSATSPNFIGRRYVIPRRGVSVSVARTGERKAPKFKYRRGHWTWQAKRFKNIEFVSVEQMPRKPDPTMVEAKRPVMVIDFDSADKVLTEKFRACHERQWIEGFLFDEEDENQSKQAEKQAK